jgi:hypothetical protein
MNPSNSTIASAGIGIPVSVIGAWILKEFYNIEMPGEVTAAIAGLITVISGLFFKGGLRAHTE